MTEWQTLDDSLLIAFRQFDLRPQSTASLRILTGEQMPLARTVPHDLSGSGDFKPLGDGFSCFLCSTASHNYLFDVKRGGTIETSSLRIKGFS